MKHLPIVQYVGVFRKIGSGHPTAYVYQFIANDMKKMPNTFQYSFSWNGAVR